LPGSHIHIGVGGWTYEPWRGTFYPKGLPQARELEYMGQHLTAIEINATYYSLQKPASFEKWAAATPPGFVFSVKASRYCTNRRVLAEAGEAVERFLGQGLTRLGDKLGPILWQFMPTKGFDREDLAAFLSLLPASRDGLPLRHAIEVRHESFRDPAFVDLARDHGVAIVFADHAEYPAIADLTAEFVYARLQQSREEEPAGYSEAELDRWAGIAGNWAEGKRPQGLDYLAPPVDAPSAREVYLFIISGAKVRAPAAASALIGRIG
jgi:uncharacterized protein YecE (DUF72 family)